MFALLSLLVFVAAPPTGAATPYEKEIAAALADTRAVYAVPASLVRAIIRRESAFNPRARSRAGALGLMQVMPETALKVGVPAEKLLEPGPNILAGTRLLTALLRHYQGDLISALVAYNARPRELGAPLPDNGETPEYVRAVLGFFQAYQRAAVPPSPPGAPAPKPPPVSPQTSAAGRSTRKGAPPPTQQGGGDQR